MDVHDIYIEHILPLLIQYVHRHKVQVLKGEGELREVNSMIDILEGWDFAVTSAGQAPLIYMSWELLMKRSMLGKIVPNQNLKVFLLKPYPPLDHFYFRTLYHWLRDPQSFKQYIYIYICIYIYILCSEWCEAKEWQNSKEPCKDWIIRNLLFTKKFMINNVGKLQVKHIYIYI